MYRQLIFIVAASSVLLVSWVCNPAFCVDPEQEREAKKAGSKYIVPVGYDGPSRGWGGTRLNTVSSQVGFAMVKIPAAANWRNEGCYFVREFDKAHQLIRIMATRDGAVGIGYDLTGEKKHIVFLNDPQALEWIREPVGEQNERGSCYLKVANGKLQGWYLSFEEQGKEIELGFPGNAWPFATYWKAQLTPKPGHMSKVRFSSTPFKEP